MVDMDAAISAATLTNSPRPFNNQMSLCVPFLSTQVGVVISPKRPVALLLILVEGIVHLPLLKVGNSDRIIPLLQQNQFLNRGLRLIRPHHPAALVALKGILPGLVRTDLVTQGLVGVLANGERVLLARLFSLDPRLDSRPRLFVNIEINHFESPPPCRF